MPAFKHLEEVDFLLPELKSRLPKSCSVSQAFNFKTFFLSLVFVWGSSHYATVFLILPLNIGFQHIQVVSQVSK